MQNYFLNNSLEDLGRIIFVQAIQYSRQEYVEEYVSIFQTVDLGRISIFINLQ